MKQHPEEAVILLLEATLAALNEMRNMRVDHETFRSTYAVAAAITKYLRDGELARVPMLDAITNAQRSAWAEVALHAYARGKEGGDDLYDLAELVLSDFLTDLMHYAGREGIDFAACVGRAEGHYQEEASEENAPPW